VRKAANSILPRADVIWNESLFKANTFERPDPSDSGQLFALFCWNGRPRKSRFAKTYESRKERSCIRKDVLVCSKHLCSIGAACMTFLARIHEGQSYLKCFRCGKRYEWRQLDVSMGDYGPSPNIFGRCDGNCMA